LSHNRQLTSEVGELLILSENCLSYASDGTYHGFSHSESPLLHSPVSKYLAE